MFEIADVNNRKCTLYNPKLKYGINIDFADFPYLGIWAKRNQDYICIEPWQGMDDHDQQEPFDTKIGIYKLMPGEIVEKQVTLSPIFAT